MSDRLRFCMRGEPGNRTVRILQSRPGFPARRCIPAIVGQLRALARSHQAGILTVVVAVLSACTSGESTMLTPTPTPWDAAGHRVVRLGERFVLKVGELVELDMQGGAAGLRFGEVRGDSRCPKDVVCVRAGDATVVLRGVDPNGESTVMEFIVGGKENPTSAFAGYAVAVGELLPYPVSTAPISQDEYRVTVLVSKP